VQEMLELTKLPKYMILTFSYVVVAALVVGVWTWYVVVCLHVSVLGRWIFWVCRP